MLGKSTTVTIKLAAKSLQLCPTLWDPIDGNPPGSPVPGILPTYSFVFLDCPPSFGPLTVNALAAADRVIVPVQAEYYALEGLSQLLGSIDLVKRRLNPRLGVAGILLTMVDVRTRLAAEVERELRSHF